MQFLTILAIFMAYATASAVETESTDLKSAYCKSKLQREKYYFRRMDANHNGVLTVNETWNYIFKHYYKPHMIRYFRSAQYRRLSPAQKRQVHKKIAKYLVRKYRALKAHWYRAFHSYAITWKQLKSYAKRKYC